jgi:hypothetical protein
MPGVDGNKTTRVYQSIGTQRVEWYIKLNFPHKGDSRVYTKILGEIKTFPSLYSSSNLQLKSTSFVSQTLPWCLWHTVQGFKTNTNENENKI